MTRESRAGRYGTEIVTTADVRVVVTRDGGGGGSHELENLGGGSID